MPARETLPMAKQRIYHIMALTAIVIWGTTFASTKVLLDSGLSPAAILLYRFLLAYVVMWLFKPGFLFGRTLKDELLFVGAGITGGSLYFLTENTALQYTLSSNVALIVGIAPIVTIILSRLLLKNVRIRPSLIYGSVIAFLGLALVVYNGHFVLKFNPVGDLLALTSAVSWAFYNIFLKLLDKKYSIYTITRKVFFYGVVTLLPVFIFEPLDFDPGIVFQTKVIANILFLGLVASLLCFAMWNEAVKQLGTVITANYIYLVPLVALVTAVVVLGEKLTVMGVAGAILILGGVWTADKFGKIKG